MAPARSPEPENPQIAFYRRAPQLPANSWLTSGLLGFEFEVRALVAVPASGRSPVTAPNLYPGTTAGNGDPTGNILRGTEPPYGYDPFAISIAAGYRFMPAFSVGGWFEYLSFQDNDQTDTGDYVDGTSQLQRTVLQGGVYGRYYLTTLHRALHPWAEIGVGYTYDTAGYVRGAPQGPQGPTTIDYYLTYQGLVTTFRVGLDWRLAPIFSLGPVVGYSQAFALSGCADAEPQSDQFNGTGLKAMNTCDSGTVPASSYGVISLGIFAKVTIGPDVR